MKKILAFILAILLVLPVNLAWGQSDEGYGETETALGQFVDSFENLDNVSVAVQVVRNATLDLIELNGTGYTEYIEAPFQLREHKRYAAHEPNVYWTLGAGDLREYTTNAPWGDGYMFVNCDPEWLEGKFVRLRWFTVGSQINRPLYFKVYDGHYERDSLTDFANDTAITEKGNGLLYSYREPDFNAWRTRDFEMTIDTWNHSLPSVMLCIYLWDGYQFYTRAYLEWIEWNDGAGGADNIFNITFSNVDMNEVQEQIGTYWDYGYINNTGLPVSGGGYETSGYLTTTDYLDYVNGSSLVLQTITKIVPDTHITVQFSDDNATWGDAEGIPGDSHDLDGGFESIDLRPWNESGAVYVMYNLTTTTITVSPYLNQSRLITTEGAGGVGGGGVTINQLNGTWIYYNLTAIANITGVHDTGTVASTYFIDGNTWNCSEVVGVPGYEVKFNATGIDTEAISLWLVAYVEYDGSASHEVNVELWNFTSSAFVELGEIPDMLAFDWMNFTVYGMRVPLDFVNSTGAIVGRVYHADAGNINHDIIFDRINILAFVPTGLAVAGAGAGANWGLLWFFLILICVPILLVLLKGSKR